jgi:hypothetical protein
MNIRAKVYGGANEQPLLRAKKPKGAKADDLHSVAVAREETRRANNRLSDRHRLVQERVSVTYESNSYEEELVNLSGGGAMLTASFNPMLWDRVDLHLGEHGTIECAVRWIRDGRIGVEFAHETRLDCSADELALLLRETIGRSFPDMEFATAQAQGAPKSAAAESRRAKRHPLIWSGVLHHDFESTPVRLRNISATGAMVETTAMIAVGSEPLLQLGEDVSVSTRVEWAVGDQIGLSFLSYFDMQQLAQSPPEVAPEEWDRPACLDKANALGTPWDPRWERLSLSELGQELEGFIKR